jgi:hypothetical protein
MGAIAPKQGTNDALSVDRPESLDRKALAAAFLRARELLSALSTVTVPDALEIEQALRPLASAAEIQEVVVPLLDRAELYGLAMAWDSSTEGKSEDWLSARVQRWIALRAPEFAFITLCEWSRLNSRNDSAHQQAESVLGEERELRGALFATNLDAVAEVDPELSHSLHKSHRTSVALRPVGAGLAEFAGPGQPWVQLWAVTPEQALADAEALVRKGCTFEDAFVAGIGDCSLPFMAARNQPAPNARVHIVELHIARVRALLELVDLSDALRERRLWLHVGPRAVDTLAAFAQKALGQPASLIGGDSLAISLLRAAAGVT